MKRINKNLGYVQPGKGAIVFDQNLFYEVNLKSYEEIVYFYVTRGRRLKNKSEIRILKEVMSIIGFTDPRLWPNRIMGYCGVKNTTQPLAMAASLVSMDSKVFGTQPVLRCYRLIKKLTEDSIDKKDIVRELINQYGKVSNVPGFNRVFNTYDDRVPYLVKILKEEKFTNNVYFKTVKNLQKILLDDYNMQMNVAVVSALIFHLIGSKDEKEIITALSLSLTIAAIPSYLDGIENNQEFIKIEEDEIEYTGSKNKEW